MDHVGIVVDDLAAATVFFVELGLDVRAVMEFRRFLAEEIS
jgi:catechol 2,3-dioxygenase-like lactoylglutathione lyase family enzyme